MNSYQAPYFDCCNKLLQLRFVCDGECTCPNAACDDEKDCGTASKGGSLGLCEGEGEAEASSFPVVTVVIVVVVVLAVSDDSHVETRNETCKKK